MSDLPLNATNRQKALWMKAQTVVVGECWEWQNGRHGVGYGSVSRKVHKSSYTHRAMYEFVVGPIPHGLYVLHECDNRLCINPAHLWPGTHLENIQDMQAKGRHRGGSSPNESNPSCKFSDQQITDIRILVAAGMAKREIEKAFGISETQYYRVIKRISRNSGATA